MVKIRNGAISTFCLFIAEKSKNDVSFNESYPLLSVNKCHFEVVWTKKLA